MPAVPGPPRPGTGSGDHQVRQAMDTPSLPLPTRHSLAGVHYREFRTEGAYSSSPRPQGSAFLNPGKTVTLRSPRKLCTQALMRFGRICLHLSCSLRFTRCYNVAKHPDSRSGLRFPQAAHALRCLGGGSGTRSLHHKVCPGHREYSEIRRKPVCGSNGRGSPASG